MIARQRYRIALVFPFGVTLAVSPGCHPEPIRFAQGKLREGSLLMGREMLRCAQHDNTGFGR